MVRTLLSLLTLPAVVRATIAVRPRDFGRGALLFGAGDVVAQLLENHGGSSARVDGDRLAKATAIGTIYGGAMLPVVYQLAESLFPGRSPRNVVLKTAVSCGLLSTGGNYFSLATRKLLSPPFHEHENIADRLVRCLNNVNDIFHGVLLDDLRVWPLYDLLCFSLVPPALRPTATSLVSVCWHTYVSTVAHKPSCQPSRKRASNDEC